MQKHKEEEETEGLSLLDSWVHHSSLDFHTFSDSEAAAIRQALLEWYQTHRRKLPWRGDAPPWTGSTAGFAQKQAAQQQQEAKANKKKQQKMTDFFGKTKTTTSSSSSSSSSSHDVAATEEATTDAITDATTRAFPVTPYGVWVSEIMLQQTRVEAVVPYWVRWMTSFPTVQHLAAATPEQVNAHWSGLGFYRRGRLLHQAAQELVAQHHHSNNNSNDDDEDVPLPQTVEDWMKLPGIGRYTASAISSIAGNVTVPVVDGNVCRVLSRLRGIAQHVKAPQFKDVHGWTLAQAIVEAGDGQYAGEVNQALMELGATYCAPAGTGIEAGDPLTDFYWSTRLGRQAAARPTVELEAMLQEAQSRAAAAASAAALASTAKTRSKTKKKGPNGGGDGLVCCPLCGPDGVSVALENLITALDESDNLADKNDRISSSSKCGHAVFPLAPPKAAKREEVLAVAALSCLVNKEKEEEAWLLVRRPETGLLAGQWEFPSSCVWTSETENKKGGQKKNHKRKKDMSKSIPTISETVRRQALDELLQQLLLDDKNEQDGRQAVREVNRAVANLKRSPPLANNGAPVEHVFSHVRHTMWIETARVTTTVNDSLLPQQLDDEWSSANGRRVRWMTWQDMQTVGITSGVKKILRTVQQQSNNNNKTLSNQRTLKRTKQK